MIAKLTYLKDAVGVRAKGRGGAVADPAFVEGWGLPVWRDEFDQPAIDTAKWIVRDHATHGSLSYDWGYIQAANASVSNNQLRLRISQRQSPITASGRVRYWDSAYLDTIGTFSQTYGRWEVRAQIPTVALQSQGVWPAFWLRNESTGEIDIMESWGDQPRNRTRNANLTETSTATIHESTAGGGQSYGVTYEHRALPGQSPYTTAQGFHTWAVEYTPTYLRFFFDGVMTENITPTGDTHSLAGANQTRDFSWVWGTTFTSPWSIRLNVQMGDPYWSSDTDPGTGALNATMPADYIVDYVRAWEYQT